MSMDERQMLARCLRGDAQAQEMLVRKFSNLIYSTIMGAMRAKNAGLSQSDVEDLHSLVFVKLFDRRCRKLRQYRGKNGCSLASWIRMVAVRTFLDHLRQAKDALARPERVLPLEALPAMETNVASALESLEAHEQRQILTAAMQTLSPRDKLVIRMHCLEGYPLKQMAALLKVSEDNIHSIKYRAVQRLKEAVRGRMRESEP